MRASVSGCSRRLARFLVPQQINDAKAEAAKHEEDARVLQAKKSDLESNAVAVREAKTGEAETLEQERQRLAEELAAKIGDLDANADNVRRRAEELCQEKAAFFYKPYDIIIQNILVPKLLH